MKKIVLAIALVAFVAGLGSAFAATNYTQAAIKAAKDAGCITSTQDIEVSVDTTAICFVSGDLKTAYVYYVPFSNCHDTPNKPCPKPAVQLKATVEFGCAGEVIAVTCY